MGKHKRSRRSSTSSGRIPPAGRSSSTTAAPARRGLAPVIINPTTLEPTLGSWWGLGPGEAAAVGLSVVWRCMTVIADAIAPRRWIERRGTDELPPSRLVRRPAATMTRREWTWKVVATMALYNHAPLWMVGGVDSEGVPGSLLPVAPDLVTPIGEIDYRGIVPPTRYRIGDTEVSAEELAWSRRALLPSIAPQYSSLLMLARRAFGAAISAEGAASRYWQTGGAPVVVLTTDQELTDAQAEKIGDRWRDRRMLGPDYPAVLGKGATAEPFGADPTKESATEARAEMAADLARYFGVPARLANVTAHDSRTYATTEADGLDFIRYTLSGYADPIADLVSELLPGDYLTARSVLIDLSELTRAEQESRYRAWTSALGGAGGPAWMRVAEVRAAEGLAPDDELEAAQAAALVATAVPGGTDLAQVPAPDDGASPPESAQGAAVDVNPGADAGSTVEPDPGRSVEVNA